MAISSIRFGSYQPTPVRDISVVNDRNALATKLRAAAVAGRPIAKVPYVLQQPVIQKPIDVIQKPIDRLPPVSVDSGSGVANIGNDVAYRFGKPLPRQLPVERVDKPLPQTLPPVNADINEKIGKPLPQTLPPQGELISEVPLIFVVDPNGPTRPPKLPPIIESELTNRTDRGFKEAPVVAPPTDYIAGLFDPVAGTKGDPRNASAAASAKTAKPLPQTLPPVPVGELNSDIPIIYVVDDRTALKNRPIIRYAPIDVIA
jgi:hypothetical protein